MNMIKRLMQSAAVLALVVVVVVVMFPDIYKAEDCEDWVMRERPEDWDDFPARQFWESADFTKVEACIAQGKDLNEKGWKNRTPLHDAALLNDDPAIIDLLIRHGADANAKHEDGWPPLHEAATDNNNPKIIDRLVHYGVKVDARAKNGNTPLHIAASNKNPAIFYTLIRHGADVNATTENEDAWRPLHRAAVFNENPAMIDLLISHGVEVNEKDGDGNTPLHLAALRNENPAIIDVLVCHGADIDARNYWGETPLERTQYNSNPDIRNVLNLRKATIEGCESWVTKSWGWVAVSARGYIAKEFWESSDLAKIENHIAHGADPRAKSEWGSPLHFAARYNGNPGIIDLLIHHGADVDARDEYGKIPLHYAAVWSENPAIIETLLDAKSDGSIKDNDGKTPFDLISENSPLHGTYAYWRLNKARFK